MFDSGIAILDWLGIAAFTITGALAASRNQMDVVGFVLLGTITGIGGGTLRDILLDIHPVLWIDRPAYLVVCIGISVVLFFTAQRPRFTGPGPPPTRLRQRQPRHKPGEARSGGRAS